MSGVVDNIRAKIKRRFSHKEPNTNFDEHDEADEETYAYVNKEVEEHEKNDEHPYGKPGSLVNRMIMHGNKKTEDEINAGNSAGVAHTATTTSATQGQRV